MTFPIEGFGGGEYICRRTLVPIEMCRWSELMRLKGTIFFGFVSSHSVLYHCSQPKFVISSFHVTENQEAFVLWS